MWRQVLEFVAQITPEECVGTTSRMLDTTPLLEAYGNAVMPRNDDSSRFGKLYKVHFNESRMITGCEIEEYLLEKSRVTMQAPGERNFHIFYRMMAGLRADEKVLG